MIKRWAKIIIFVIFIFVIAGAMLEYSRYFEKEILIQVATAKFGDLEEIVEMSGQVDSENTETILSNAEGIIGNLKIEEGDRVKKGERLCTIRSPRLRARLLEMKAQLVTARENMGLALAESERKMTQARYNFLRSNIADFEETMRPKSHIEGDAIKVEVQNGSQIVPGMTLFFLADMSRPVVKARMDESDVQKVKAGQPVWITGDFLSGRTLQGKVSKISKFVDREIGTYVETTCMIFNPQNLPLKYGAYSEVKVITARRKNVLLIPVEALIVDKGEHVFVVKGERAHLTPIKIGIIGEKYAEVLSGLRAGEQVATVGSLDLAEGDKVKQSTGAN